MPIQHSGHHRRSTGRWSGHCNLFRCFVSAAVISQLFVFRYLAGPWPKLDHPYKPPTSSSNSNLGSSANVQQQKGDDSRVPDGYFNGVPIYYHNSDESSSKIRPTTVQCVGENFESNNAWLFRSCKFQNLCFDATQKDFVYIQSTLESDLKDTLERAAKSKEFITISSLVTERTKLSLGLIRSDMSPKDEEKLKWFPRIVKEKELSTSGFYQFPPNRVLVPFQAASSSDKSLAQLVWNDFFPIYQLLSMFQLTALEGMRPIFVAPQKLQDHHANLYAHLLPLIAGSTGERISSAQDFLLEDSTQQQRQPRANLICSHTAVAGLGMVADRGGFNLPERWQTKNPAVPPTVRHPISVNLFTHNVAQGIVLKSFRDRMLENLAIINPQQPPPPDPPQVAFYLNHQANLETAIMKGVLASNAEVSFSSLKPLEPSSSMVGTFRGAVESSVLVVECCSEDAALVASFLPHGSSLLVMFDEKQYTGVPLEKAKNAFPTWELLVNAGYIRTHWFSKGSGEGSIAPLMEALKKELILQKSYSINVK